MAALNYKHLRYFWMVAKAGGVARAGKQLHLTPQSISGQLRELQETLGVELFRRAGRNLELTDIGHLALSYAEKIFSLGDELLEALPHGAVGRALPFRVGIVDVVPKSVAYRLVEPAMRLEEPMRIVCREGQFLSLLADLAVQRLDLVIADQPLPSSINVRGFNHLLGECGLTFFAAAALARRYKGGFPQSLDGAPLLLPGENAAVRPNLMRWFEKLRIRPQIVGEFDDGALLNAFGKAGIGVFAAPSAIAQEVHRQYGVAAIGRTEEVTERFYAISVERRLTHPAVVAISSEARRDLFSKALTSRAPPAC